MLTVNHINTESTRKLVAYYVLNPDYAMLFPLVINKLKIIVII